MPSKRESSHPITSTQRWGKICKDVFFPCPKWPSWHHRAKNGWKFTGRITELDREGCQTGTLRSQYHPPLTAQQPPVGQGYLNIEASRSHSDTPHSIGHLWTSDQPNADASTWQHTTLTQETASMRPTGFEITIPTSERPKSKALDVPAFGIGKIIIYRM